MNAAEEMERAREEVQLREERKALTSGAGAAPAAPRMNIKVSIALRLTATELNWLLIV